MTHGTPKAFSTATDRTLTILEVLATSPEPQTLTAIAASADVPIATCAAALYSLEARGYASRTVVGRSHFWSLTLALYSLASQQMNRLDLASLARRDLEELSHEVGLPAHVGVLSGSKLVYLAKEAGPSFIQFDTYPGKVVPFNLTALGRAIAASLPDSQLDVLVKTLESGTGPKARSESAEGFRRILQDVLDAGYAVEDEEEVAGVVCIAAPFFDRGGAVVGAIGVTSIADRVTEPQRVIVADAVMRAAATLTRRLGGARPAPS